MRALGRVAIGLLILAVIAVGMVAGLTMLYRYQKAPLPLQDQCVARVAEMSAALDAEQAHNAAIIVGVAVQRELAPRASTIALATVYQESGLYNLDYGDRDSLGLFQQRPSQGWGTPAQVRDPVYASNKFYDALLKVNGWQSGDVNDVAQAVQRSGHPKGYVRHVENARRIASSLTGETPASFSCVVKNLPQADSAGMAAFLTSALPAGTTVSQTGDAVTVKATNSRTAWAAAQLAVATTAVYGTSSVEVGGRSWTVAGDSFASWTGTPDNATTATIRFAAPVTPTPSR
ncbi:MAG: hypothetical protein QM708_05065 [Propioniciclava sp.]|uniref:hypothetical protein n=1 Tax=Propioniciclava sp. TaxID=2038686 RepID=UPI0039E4AB66